MIEDVDDLPAGAQVRAEIGIVGAGFAGIDLARKLGAAGVDVVLLESGRRAFDPRIQELARVVSVGKPLREPSPASPFTPYLDPVFRGEFRIRQFGGTSTIWTGKWRTFDTLDFAERPWIPGSGWPLTRDDLEPYYREVAEAYGLGDFEAFAAQAPVRDARTRLADFGLKLSFHHWQAQPSRPGLDHQHELEQAANIRVLLGANVTEIVLDDERRSVSSLEFRSLDGRAFRLVAERFVLATGGLETARLLLASDRQRPAGVGNDHGLVGRFHMDHPKSKQARLHPGPDLEMIEKWTRTQPRPRFHVSLSLSDQAQREAEVLDHAVYLSPVYRYEVDYPEMETQGLQRALAGRRPIAIVTAAVRLLCRPRAVWKVLQRRRHRDRGGPVAHYRASMYVEQAPNPDSRLRLVADDRDELGMPRLVVDWQLADLDHRSFDRVVAELTDRLEDAGIGTLDFGPDGASLDEWVDAAHHIGATRMADSPERGVVDPDCRVYGTTNLYVASSSVFPTGHSAAPTMTILALARRLADHLLAGRP